MFKYVEEEKLNFQEALRLLVHNNAGIIITCTILTVIAFAFTILAIKIKPDLIKDVDKRSRRNKIIALFAFLSVIFIAIPIMSIVYTAYDTISYGHYESRAEIVKVKKEASDKTVKDQSNDKNEAYNYLIRIKFNDNNDQEAFTIKSNQKLKDNNKVVVQTPDLAVSKNAKIEIDSRNLLHIPIPNEDDDDPHFSKHDLKVKKMNMIRG